MAEISEMERIKLMTVDTLSSRQRRAVARAWLEIRALAIALSIAGQRQKARRLASVSRDMIQHFHDSPVQRAQRAWKLRAKSEGRVPASGGFLR